MSRVSGEFERDSSLSTISGLKPETMASSSKTHLRDINVSTHDKGEKHPAITEQTRASDSSSGVNDLVQLTNNLVNQLTQDVELHLEMSPPRAKRLVDSSVNKYASSWLKRIALLPHKLQFRAIRGYRLWLWDMCNSDTQLRYYAKKKLRRKLAKMSAERYRRYICETSPAELMLELGYHSPSIQRYQEMSQLKKEWLARQTLRQFGLRDRNAFQFLESPQESPLDQGTILADEIVELGRNPALHPVASRVTYAAGEKPRRRIICELDEILSQRQQATQRLRATGWSVGQITTWLRHCSRDELKSVAQSQAKLPSGIQPTSDNIEIAVFGMAAKPLNYGQPRPSESIHDQSQSETETVQLNQDTVVHLEHSDAHLHQETSSYPM